MPYQTRNSVLFFPFLYRTELYCCAWFIWEAFPYSTYYPPSPMLHDEQMIPFAFWEKRAAQGRCTTLHTTLETSVGVWQGRGIGHRPQLIMYCIYFFWPALVALLDMEIIPLLSMRLGIMGPAGSSRANASRNSLLFHTRHQLAASLLELEPFFPGQACTQAVVEVMLLWPVLAVTRPDLFACVMGMLQSKLGACTVKAPFCRETGKSCCRSTPLG